MNKRSLIAVLVCAVMVACGALGIGFGGLGKQVKAAVGVAEYGWYGDGSDSVFEIGSAEENVCPFDILVL